jgi:pimeloyl-ACP methyl ester carboxylesterase
MLDLLARHWLLLSVVLSVLAVLWIIAVLSKYVRLMLNILRDTPVPLMGPMDYARIEGHQVNFRSFDGTMLRGMFLSQSFLSGPKQNENGREENSALQPDNGRYLNGDTRGVVVFCHEYGSDMFSCARYCRSLLEAGFDVFTFDFRSHGSSSSLKGYEPRLWCSDKEVADCLGALALVQAMLEERRLDVNIGMFGISRGANAAIMAAAQASPALSIKALVADGAFSTDTTLEWSMKKWVHIFARVRFVYENHRPIFWHFLRWLLLKFARVRFGCSFPSVRKSLHRIKKMPIFFIHGKKDSYIQPEHTQMLFDAAKDPRFLWIVPEARHNQSVITEPGLYSARTVAFFEKYMTQTGYESLRIPEDCKGDIKEFFSTGQKEVFARQGKKDYEDINTVDRVLCGPQCDKQLETIRETTVAVPPGTGPAAKENLKCPSGE